jgi:hypothetical protein
MVLRKTVKQNGEKEGKGNGTINALNTIANNTYLYNSEMFCELMITNGKSG